MSTEESDLLERLAAQGGSILRLGDADGELRLALGVDAEGGRAALYGADGKVRLGLKETERGGQLEIFDGNGVRVFAVPEPDADEVQHEDGGARE